MKPEDAYDNPDDEYKDSKYRKRKAGLKGALGFIKLTLLILLALSFVYFKLLAQ